MNSGPSVWVYCMLLLNLGKLEESPCSISWAMVKFGPRPTISLSSSLTRRVETHIPLIPVYHKSTPPPPFLLSFPHLFFFLSLPITFSYFSWVWGCWLTALRHCTAPNASLCLTRRLSVYLSRSMDYLIPGWVESTCSTLTELIRVFKAFVGFYVKKKRKSVVTLSGCVWRCGGCWAVRLQLSLGSWTKVMSCTLTYALWLMTLY